MKGFGTRDFKRASNATICTEIHKWARTHAAFIAYINIQFISPCLQHGITGMFVPFSSSPSPFSPFSLFSPNSTLISTYSNALFPPLSLPGAAPSLSFPPTFHSPPFALILYISASASSLHPPPVFPACSVHQSPFFLILCFLSSLCLSFPPFPSLTYFSFDTPSSSILLWHNLLFLLVFLCLFLLSLLLFSFFSFKPLCVSSPLQIFFFLLFSSACFSPFSFSFFLLVFLHLPLLLILRLFPPCLSYLSSSHFPLPVNFLSPILSVYFFPLFTFSPLLPLFSSTPLLFPVSLFPIPLFCSFNTMLYCSSDKCIKIADKGR